MSYIFVLIILFTLNSFSNAFSNNNINTLEYVQNLKIFSISLTPRHYSMPIYFQCNFTIFNTNFVILFKQSHLPFVKHFDHIKTNRNDQFFETYQSVYVKLNESKPEEKSQFVANSVLYYKKDSKPIELINKGVNLSEKFDLMLNIFINNTHNLMISKYYDEKTLKHVYMGYYTQLSTFSDSLDKRRKRDNSNAKNKLVVETCIHIDISVYKYVLLK